MKFLPPVADRHLERLAVRLNQQSKYTA